MSNTDTITESAALLRAGQPVSQGDVYLLPIDPATIPEGLPTQKAVDGNYVLAHSETGHHHAVAAVDNVQVMDEDVFFSYIHNQTDNVVELRHHKNFDTHAPVGVPPGAFKIVRQREFTPEGFRRVVD